MGFVFKNKNQKDKKPEQPPLPHELVVAIYLHLFLNGYNKTTNNNYM